MEKGNQLVEKFSRAYASLPDNEPLKADIFVVAQDLEKNENNQLACTKLTRAISQHLLIYHLKIESEIAALCNKVADSLEKYKGNVALTITLGGLFHP